MRISSLRLALGAVLLATASLAAHATPAPTQDAPAQGRQGRGGDMFKDLNLTADQKTKVETLMKEQRGQGGMRGGQSGPPSEADRQAMQTRRAEMETKLKDILTPEQYTKYQSMRPQRGQRPSGDTPAN
ncbi:Spy/CpxP family protein refolding chaperone [Hymenobacter bucti]|uniref:Spy/CpxP family protein refolding chaperone n=1 Tax=Hymenobacter bucti TaxID=1844114 RepID=A0ABW4QYQ4_9BACT